MLYDFNNRVYGMNIRRRALKVDGKYFFGILIPSFPSNVFNRLIPFALNGVLPHHRKIDRLLALYLATTNKCPLHCEHCFEWKNLNRQEPFSIDDLKNIITRFQEQGCVQIYFTGGEPLVKINQLEELIRFSSPSSECWVLTSGLNLTAENAKRLKNAGAIGVTISLDHFDPEMHNAFRGSDHAFRWAMDAVKNANQAKLVTAFSICLTRSFVTKDNLMRYAELARSCGVGFVQLLDPKPVGHYKDKEVSLSVEQMDLLDEFYLNINIQKQYADFPVFMYHGYYQRKIGCLAAGNQVMYLDSAGFIDACPFCQTKEYNAHDIISRKLSLDHIQIGGCPAIKKQTTDSELVSVKKYY